MIIRKWWTTHRHIDMEMALKAIGLCLGGVAAVIAMFLVFTDDVEGDRIIERQSQQIDRQVVEIDRLQAQVAALTSTVSELQTRVDRNKATTDCRSHLIFDITIKTAAQQQAEGELVVALAGERTSVIGAIARLKQATDAVDAAIVARKVYEQDPSQPCPISVEEL